MVGAGGEENTKLNRSKGTIDSFPITGIVDIRNLPATWPMSYIATKIKTLIATQKGQETRRGTTNKKNRTQANPAFLAYLKH
jgi:hypothetical protein